MLKNIIQKTKETFLNPQAILYTVFATLLCILVDLMTTTSNSTLLSGISFYLKLPLLLYVLFCLSFQLLKAQQRTSILIYAFVSLTIGIIFSLTILYSQPETPIFDVLSFAIMLAVSLFIVGTVLYLGFIIIDVLINIIYDTLPKIPLNKITFLIGWFIVTIITNIIVFRHYIFDSHKELPLYTTTEFFSRFTVILLLFSLLGILLPFLSNLTAKVNALKANFNELQLIRNQKGLLILWSLLIITLSGCHFYFYSDILNRSNGKIILNLLFRIIWFIIGFTLVYRIFYWRNYTRVISPSKEKALHQHYLRLLFSCSGILLVLWFINLSYLTIFVEGWLFTYIIPFFTWQGFLDTSLHFLYNYVGEFLRQLYNIVRKMGLIVSQDWIDDIQNMATQTANNVHVESVNVSSGRALNAVSSAEYFFFDGPTIVGDWIRKPFYAAQQKANEAAQATENTIKQTIIANVELAKLIAEMLGTGFVVFVGYRFKDFFVWLYRFTINALFAIKGVLLGSPKTIQDSMNGIGGRLLKWVGTLFMVLLGIHKKVDTSRGSAFFADRSWERMKMGKGQRYNGVLIDGIKSISRKLSFRHVAVIAPSGQGKTSNYVIPNLLNLDGTMSAVVTDPKGELFHKTSTYLRDTKGYKIKVINIEHPSYSMGFNPMRRAKTDKEVMKLASILVDAAFPKSNTSDFWNSSAKMLLANLIKVLNEYQEQEIHGFAAEKNLPIELLKQDTLYDHWANLHNLRNMLNTMSMAKDKDSVDELANFVLEFAPNAQVLKEYQAFAQQDEKTYSNILVTARTALKDLAIDDIQQLTAHDTLNFESLRDEPTILYIITPPSDVEYYRFFLTLLYSQIFDYCNKEKGKMDVMFMMDEFGNLGKMPSFPQLITTLRDKRCSVSLILQDIAQLRQIYGNLGASTIINGGCSTKVIFGGIQNTETLKEISTLLGTKTIEQKGEKGEARMPIARPLMMPDEISRMSQGEGILLSAGHPPIKLKMTHCDDKRSPFKTAINWSPLEVKKENPPNIQYIDFDKFQKDDNNDAED